MQKIYCSKDGDQMTHIRPVNLTDIDGIRSVARASWNATYREIYPLKFINGFLNKAYSQESLERSITRDIGEQERKFYIAADADNNIIGYAHVRQLDNANYELLRIYVLPIFQGKGVGTALQEMIIKQQKSISSLSAWVEHDNKTGKNYYESKGYKKVEEKEETMPGFTTKMNRYELIL
jgi:ribosomal protein S18 acetylase RimI-like enzyme